MGPCDSAPGFGRRYRTGRAFGPGLARLGPKGPGFGGSSCRIVPHGFVVVGFQAIGPAGPGPVPARGFQTLGRRPSRSCARARAAGHSTGSRPVSLAGIASTGSFPARRAASIRGCPLPWTAGVRSARALVPRCRSLGSGAGPSSWPRCAATSSGSARARTCPWCPWCPCPVALGRFRWMSTCRGVSSVVSWCPSRLACPGLAAGWSPTPRATAIGGKQTGIQATSRRADYPGNTSDSVVGWTP